MHQRLYISLYRALYKLSLSSQFGGWLEGVGNEMLAVLLLLLALSYRVELLLGVAAVASTYECWCTMHVVSI